MHLKQLDPQSYHHQALPVYSAGSQKDNLTKLFINMRCYIKDIKTIKLKEIHKDDKNCLYFSEARQKFNLTKSWNEVNQGIHIRRLFCQTEATKRNMPNKILLG